VCSAFDNFMLNILGDAKDDIFEACITDAVRELIS